MRRAESLVAEADGCPVAVLRMEPHGDARSVGEAAAPVPKILGAARLRSTLDRDAVELRAVAGDGRPGDQCLSHGARNGARRVRCPGAVLALAGCAPPD